MQQFKRRSKKFFSCLLAGTSVYVSEVLEWPETVVLDGGTGAQTRWAARDATVLRSTEGTFESIKF